MVAVVYFPWRPLVHIKQNINTYEMKWDYMLKV